MPQSVQVLSQGAASAIDTYSARAQAGSADNPDWGQPAIVLPWDKGGFQSYVLDLSQLATEKSLGANGYEVLYLWKGSSPGGVLFLNGVPVFPGTRVRGYFEELRIRRGIASDGALFTSATSGQAFLVVQKTPGLLYRELPTEADSGGTVVEAQTTTNGAPTSLIAGASLRSTGGTRITVAADAGQTLSGTGTFDVYYLQPTLGIWSLNPDLALSVPAAVSGLRSWTAPDLPAAVPQGRIAIASNGVGVSSGGLSVYYDVGAN